MEDLSFCTCEDLINELRNRATFAGIMFISDGDVINNLIKHDNWQIFYPGLTEEQVYDILVDAAEHFKGLMEETA